MVPFTGLGVVKELLWPEEGPGELIASADRAGSAGAEGRGELRAPHPRGVQAELFAQCLHHLQRKLLPLLALFLVHRVLDGFFLP